MVVIIIKKLHHIIFNLVDMSGEEMMEATVAESTPVQWRRVSVRRKAHVGTLAFQCSSQYGK